jgi:hypothetical protein
MLRLQIVAAAFVAVATASPVVAQPLSPLREPDRLPDSRGADYVLPYGTYSGGYSNWRTYGLVGNRVAQYGPLSNKSVPRWKYNVRTGNPDGFDLKTR